MLQHNVFHGHNTNSCSYGVVLFCTRCLVLQHNVFPCLFANNCSYGVVLCYSVLTVLCYSITFFMATILTAMVLCFAVLSRTVLYCLVLQHYVFHSHNTNSCSYDVVLYYSVLTVLCYSITFFIATKLTVVAMVLCCIILY